MNKLQVSEFVETVEKKKRNGMIGMEMGAVAVTEGEMEESEWRNGNGNWRRTWKKWKWSIHTDTETE